MIRMHKNQLTKEQDILCKMISNVMFQTKFDKNQFIDFDKVYECAKKQAVITPAFLNSNEYQIDDLLKNKIFSNLISQADLTARNYSYHAYLHSIMKKHHVEYCVLKGVASAHYYPQPMIRQMGDVDFIIKPEDTNRVETILKQEGFHRLDQNHCCHKVYIKEDMYFEMHFDFPGLPDQKQESAVREVLSNFFNETQEIIEDGFTCVVPSDFYHGLVMLMHTQKHLISEGIGLRHLCDWAVFIQSVDNFEQLFKDRLQKIGLWKYAILLSKACSIAFDLPVQSYMSKDDDLALMLLRDILDGGNFGANNDQRYVESLFITDYERKNIGHKRLVQFIRTMNSMIKDKWPQAQKFPILIIIGWIYFPCRRIKKICTQEKAPIHLKQVFSESKDRKELYEKIEIYK